MAKTRRIFGFNFETGKIATPPGKPTKLTVNLPTGATFRDICVDGAGNFILFAECWSHPEGTVVNHEEVQFLLVGSQMDVPAGWDYVLTIMTMKQAFHFFRRGTPKLELASG
jgi:hypothetical protein